VAQGEGRVDSLTRFTATRERTAVVAVGVAALAVTAGWAAHHAMTARAILSGRGELPVIYLCTFLVLAWQVVLCLLDRPRLASSEQVRELDKLHVVIAVPAYNEDPALLARSLSSMLRQTRLPDHIVVVDDGSDLAQVDYDEVRFEFEASAAVRGVRATWVRTENGGKRHAQAVAVRLTPEADIYVTVDSDGILDKRALAELLYPFADLRVQSSAGIVLAANNTVNLLARFTDLCYVTSQLVARSSLSVMASVLVNSGVLAAYRAPVIRGNLHAYLNETFFGRPVKFSDDSMLTTFAFLAGRTVQQPTAFVFTAMPERVDHHVRQYMRWMRGSFIRSWWRFRYLPLGSYAYWWHLLSWVQTVISVGVCADLYVRDPLDGQFHLAFLLVPVLVGYGQSLRYLTFRRRDQRFRSQFATWLLAPVSVAWSFTMLRGMRWYGAATCWKPGWGTRQDGVEVTLDSAS
jgi:hyaluronan synthase